VSDPGSIGIRRTVFSCVARLNAAHASACVLNFLWIAPGIPVTFGATWVLADRQFAPNETAGQVEIPVPVDAWLRSHYYSIVRFHHPDRV
jgi:hypothetical protein